jgi:glycerol-3-phosphate acyltransferase PlsY
VQILVWLGGSALAGYLLGSLPIGYLVARARGVDLRQQGSGNIGATNVGRVLGRRYGIAVFALDFTKGALPTFLAGWLGQKMVAPLWPAGADWLALAAGLGAFLGHLFPLYLGFRGGKGVATGAGVASVLLPGPALVGLGVWLVVLCASSYVSLASLLAVLAVVLDYVLATPQPLAAEHLPQTLFCSAAAGLVFWAHRSNLLRLLHRRELRLREDSFLMGLRHSLYLLAVSCWFGMLVFFSLVVGPVLFRQWRALAEEGTRPNWFPLAAAFERRDWDFDGPREQGTRAAGFTVSQLFPWYYLLQGICGFVAVGACLGQQRTAPTRRGAWRCRLLLLALGLVVLGWGVERYVRGYQELRDQTIEQFLQSPPEREPLARQAAEEARAQFGRWHLVSLALNLGTLASVTLVLVLSALDLAAPATGEAAIHQTAPATAPPVSASPAAAAPPGQLADAIPPASERINS